MIYNVVCYEDGKKVSTIGHDDRNMAMECCRMFVIGKVIRSAYVMVHNVYYDSFWGTPRGYIFNREV